jgi:hypothetical protein
MDGRLILIAYYIVILFQLCSRYHSVECDGKIIMNK